MVNSEMTISKQTEMVFLSFDEINCGNAIFASDRIKFYGLEQSVAVECGLYKEREYFFFFTFEVFYLSIYLSIFFSSFDWHIFREIH